MNQNKNTVSTKPKQTNLPGGTRQLHGGIGRPLPLPSSKKSVAKVPAAAAVTSAVAVTPGEPGIAARHVTQKAQSTADPSMEQGLNAGESASGNEADHRDLKDNGTSTNQGLSTAGRTKPIWQQLSELDQQTAKRKSLDLAKAIRFRIDNGRRSYTAFGSASPVDVAVQTMIDHMPDDADDSERLALCCDIAVVKFDGRSDAQTAEAIYLYSALGRFSTPPDDSQIIEEIIVAKKRDEARKAADAVGMHPPSELLQRGKHTDDLIPAVLPMGQLGTISGAKNRLKTSIALDACISLATGTKFLNHFSVGFEVPTAIFAAEDADEDLDDTVKRICRSKGIDHRDLDANCFISAQLPLRYDQEWCEQTMRFIERNNICFCVIEGSYLALGGADQRSLQVMGDAISPLKWLCNRSGGTFMMSLHHKAASDSRWPILGDIAGVGFEEVARFWWLLNSRRDWKPATGQHALRLLIGNKRGEQRYHIDVREGHEDDPEGRVWEPMVTPVEHGEPVRKPHPSPQANAKGSLDKYKDAFMSVLAARPGGLSMTAIGRAANVPDNKWQQVIDSLINDGRIEEVEITVSNQKTPRKGYRLFQSP